MKDEIKIANIFSFSSFCLLPFAFIFHTLEF